MPPANVPPCSRGPRPLRRTTRTRRAALVALLVILCAVLPFAAACRDSARSASGSDQQAPSQVRQVLYRVMRGDVVETVSGTAELTTLGNAPTVTVRLSGDGAAQVAEGQHATVRLGDFGSGQRPRGSGTTPDPRVTTGGSPMDQGAAGRPSPPAGAQGWPRGGTGGMRGVEGTVEFVTRGTDGATAIVRLSSVPNDASAGDHGVAVIEVKILAEDVLVVPTQAITTSNGASTVRIVVNGKTESCTVEVGQRSDQQTEIVSGLKEGDNVVYEISFPGTRGSPPLGGGRRSSPQPADRTGS